MRIILDTNILLSALVFRSEYMSLIIEKVVQEHTMVICSHIIDEFRNVVSRKAPKYNNDVDKLFSNLSYEMVYTPKWHENMPSIRDEKDKPILAAAIVSDVDMIITNDNDFYDVDIERPEIISPVDFLKRY